MSWWSMIIPLDVEISAEQRELVREISELDGVERLLYVNTFGSELAVQAKWSDKYIVLDALHQQLNSVSHIPKYELCADFHLFEDMSIPKNAQLDSIHVRYKVSVSEYLRLIVYPSKSPYKSYPR